MNRTGLTIALSIGFAVGVICAVDPQLDLDLAAPFFHRAPPTVRRQRPALGAAHARSGAPDHHAPCAAGLSRHSRQADPAAAAHADRRPRRVCSSSRRWRSAPAFSPTSFSRIIGAGRGRSTCSNSAATIASRRGGIRAAIVRTIARSSPASRPARSGRWRRRRWRGPELQPLAYGAALAFGVGIGVLRIAAGAHFFSDVVFAGVFMYLLIWLAHGLIYRWPATRIDEAAVERRLAGSRRQACGAGAAADRTAAARPPEDFATACVGPPRPYSPRAFRAGSAA